MLIWSFVRFLVVLPGLCDAIAQKVAPRPVAMFSYEKPIYSLAWHPDGKTLATLEEGGWLRVRNVAQPDRDKMGFNVFGGVLATHTIIAFSPDGKTLALGGTRGEVWVWEVPTGRPRMTVRGHKGTVFCVAFSSDGHQLASSGFDGIVRLWDVRAGKELQTLKGHESMICQIAFSPDGKTLASASHDDTARLWNTADGKERIAFRGHKGNVVSVAITRDGKKILSGSHDGTVKVWDAATGRESCSLEGEWTPPIACSPNPRIAASATVGRVRLWDLETGKELATFDHEAGVRSIAFSPDGRALASGGSDGTVKLWDTASLVRQNN